MRGVELVDTVLPSPPENAVPQQPTTSSTKAVSHVAAFDASDEGWQGFERAERQAAEDGQGGFLRTDASRLQRLCGCHSAGLSRLVFGKSAGGVWRPRGDDLVPNAFAGRGGPDEVELFAGDIGSGRRKTARARKGLDGSQRDLRYDWTDDQARAAGWQPATNAFSWAKPVQNVGKVVGAPCSIANHHRSTSTILPSGRRSND